MSPVRLALVCVLATAAAAHAQDEPPADDDFGPLVEIERIAVTGNTSTAERLIRRVLPVHEGDQLRTGDARLLETRYKVLALGYFRDVKLRLDKGSRRGAIVLTVAVSERGTATLNRIFLGNSAITPVWLGFDVGDTNLLGTGVGVGAAFVWASAPEVEEGDSEAQLGLRLRVADPSILGTPVGARGAFLYNRASELENGRARRYQRVGGTAGATYQVTPTLVAALDLRLVRVATDEVAPPRYLRPGDSTLVTVAVGVDLDTRRDPILPDRGHRLGVVVEAGGGPLGDYDEARFLVRYQRWQLLAERHVGSIAVNGGLVLGTPPLFDRFYVGDVNFLLPPRALDLVVSDRASPDLLGDGMDRIRYGRAYAGVTAEYAYKLFRRARTVYGGDLFVDLGVFGLGEPDALRYDLTFNVGLRLDTFIGVFELSLGNALGRIPF